MTPATYVIMGVCGCGKSTVGALLAGRTGGTYLDGDDFHPAENRAKMGRGMPLDDADRKAWLLAVRGAIDVHPGPWPLFFGCSSLKRSYRDLLRGGARGRGAGVSFVHLSGARALLGERMASREGHYMKAEMLDSQFADLEGLAGDELGFAIDVGAPPEELADEIVRRIAG